MSTHLEGDNVPFACPLGDKRLENLRHLVHLDVQAALAGLDLVNRLRTTTMVRSLWTMTMQLFRDVQLTVAI